jgi:hypothetical protein
MTMELKAERRIEWAKPTGCPAGFETEEVYAGRSDAAGGSPIELAYARWLSTERVSREALVKLHQLRVNKRATPVVLAVELPDGLVITFGPNASAAPLEPLAAEQAQRLFQAVLDEPTALMARARLAALSQAIDSTTIPGVKNSGLFANHELRVGVPQRADWTAACISSAPLLTTRGADLITKLGYSVNRAGAHALVLTGAGPRPQAIAVMLDETEAFDSESKRFSISPVAYGLTMAEKEGVPWLIMARGSQLRLYPARIDLGVGRKGLAETFFEVDLPHLTVDNAGYLTLLFSAEALADGGSTFQIMDSSAQYAVALGERLRDKVYEEIIPKLSVAVADQMRDLGYEMDAAGLDLAYQITLRIFFRLLFQVYAEDRKLLPYKENDRYTRNALKTVAQDLVEDPDQEFDAESATLWDDLAQVWNVIDSGDRSWGVPAYNGGLFASDPELNEHGALIARLRIHNDVMGPVLRAMLLDELDEGEVGPIDFRSLSVREFGTIYEGLLESTLGLAEVDLTLDDKGTWIPSKKESDEIYAFAGQVYFHNTSGQRKGTGSYFTPSFVVEYLLERSLDPTLDDHLAKVADRLTAGDQAGAADLFFDFKVADLAMGSGHFLTAAIDHIEAKMAAFLAGEGHAIPGVANEIALLFQAAKDAVGPDAPEPEPSSLLRRQIARRCVYGLDINPIAVELARVSIWIHTFVRGLPMSSLDNNLVCANSLTGIGSVEEALDVLVPGRKGAMTLFDAPIEEALEKAKTVLIDVALMPEINRTETRAASKAVQKARKEAETARLLFDAAVLRRIGQEDLVPGISADDIAKAAGSDEAQAEIAPLQPAHMPVLFPEVFLRENGGFDVLVGNPPWKQLMVDELRFWVRAEPGLLGMNPSEIKKRVESLQRERTDLLPLLADEVSQFDQLRTAVTQGPYPGVGGGGRAPDLYHAFAWRNWQLLREGGALGGVFPRTLLSASVTAEWRLLVLDNGVLNVTTLVNSRGWVFSSVHAQFSIALVAANRRVSGAEFVELSGPYFGEESFRAERSDSGRIPVKLIKAASSGAEFPQLPDAKSAVVFAQLRKAPRLDSTKAGWVMRPVYEFNATTDRPTFDAGGPAADRWPVYGGSSFNIWEPDAGDPYAWADPQTVVAALQEKRQRQIRTRSSAFFGVSEAWAKSPETLPCMRPRVAFRDVTNATNTRTCIATLIPGEIVLTNKAPYLLRLDGTEADEAFLLGVLGSHVLDWYARRYVELCMNFKIFNGLPIPINGDDSLRSQVTGLAGRLAAKDERFSDWARAVGVPVGSVKTPEQQADMEAELDALVSHLYGLSRDQVEHIFVTFHRGWDFKPRLEAVLAHFDRIEESK